MIVGEGKEECGLHKIFLENGYNNLPIGEISSLVEGILNSNNHEIEGFFDKLIIGEALSHFDTEILSVGQDWTDYIEADNLSKLRHLEDVIEQGLYMYQYHNLDECSEEEMLSMIENLSPELIHHKLILETSIDELTDIFQNLNDVSENIEYYREKKFFNIKNKKTNINTIYRPLGLLNSREYLEKIEQASEKFLKEFKLFRNKLD